MLSLEQLTQEFRVLAAKPRMPLRAKAHMVTMQELAPYYPEFQGKDYNAWRERFDELSEEPYPQGFKDNVLAILRQKKADLRRGDFIFIEFNVGYRNDGKLMFDGKRLVELGTEPYDYGVIPEEFQIGEFPPRYWIDLINNNLVPFNLPQRLPPLTINNIRLLPRKDGKGSHMVIPFNTPLGTMFIADLSKMKTDSSPEVNAQHFIEEIAAETYFQCYNPEHDPFEEDVLSLPEGYSYENFIFYVREENYEGEDEGEEY